MTWCKSSFSEDNDGNCVEISRQDGRILLRESEEPDVLVEATPVELAMLFASLRRQHH